jgi:hypothetical protein
MGAVLLLGLLAAFAAAARPPAPVRFTDLTAPQVDALLKHAQTLPVADRIAELSSHFLGTPYVVGPLGEGPDTIPDSDPVFRLDQVDCVTFLEELWGMLWASDLLQAHALTQRMRYKDGRIGYTERLHLMWSQWLPQNEESGHIIDITSEIAGADVRRQTKTINAASCGGRWKSFCDGLGAGLPLGPHTRAVWPLKKAQLAPRRIPHGSLLFVVLDDRLWLPYRIKHAGLVLHMPDGRIVLRHASAVHGKVVDVSLSRYLTMLSERSEKWPVTGLILAQMQAPPPDSVLLEPEKPPVTPQADHPLNP